MIGVLSSLLYSRAMVAIAQGTLKKIRDELFEKMQRLPIRAFDTRTHGDIMSLYTNDTDTLRQMIAQSMAQLISIARAAVSDPPVMILDEATSSIDTRTEAMGQALRAC